MHFRGRRLLGAAPESQVRVSGGTARMTPISGTYRYAADGPTTDGLRRYLRRLALELLGRRMPLLAVCQGHQIVAAEIGLTIARLSEPAQGVRRPIVLDGRPELVGFYHSFTALSSVDTVPSPLVAGTVRVLREPGDTADHSLAGPRVRSIQFHLESPLTERGPLLLRSMLSEVTAAPAPSDDRLASDGRVRQGADRHVRC